MSSCSASTSALRAGWCTGTAGVRPWRWPTPRSIHNGSNQAWLEDGILLHRAHRLHGIPGCWVHRRLDIGSPLATAWELAQQRPDSDLSTRTANPATQSPPNYARPRIASALSSRRYHHHEDRIGIRWKARRLRWSCRQIGSDRHRMPTWPPTRADGRWSRHHGRSCRSDGPRSATNQRARSGENAPGGYEGPCSTRRCGNSPLPT